MMHFIVPGIAFILLLIAAGLLFKAMQSGALTGISHTTTSITNTRKKRSTSERG